MASIEPSNLFHISRAYQLSAARPAVRPAASPTPPTPATLKLYASAAAPARPNGIQRLIGGIVPGRIDFAGSHPMHAEENGVRAPGGALAMYRHPADKNTAATAVHAGRLLDTTA